MGKASRRQRGTDTASGQSRPKPAPFERRPFQGLAGETDWVALREILPAATAVVTVRPEHVPDGAPSEVTIATVLPLAWPGLHRADGTVFVGSQSGSTFGCCAGPRRSRPSSVAGTRSTSGPSTTTRRSTAASSSAST